VLGSFAYCSGHELWIAWVVIVGVLGTSWDEMHNEVGLDEVGDLNRILPGTLGNAGMRMGILAFQWL
jgi:hypothetical protein